MGIIHFVGIGGIGMSGIAEIMHNLGYKITGSDISESKNTLRLQKLGIKIFLSHSPANVAGASYVVISSSIKSDNLEVKAALEHKIPVIKRSAMLGELMRLKSSIAISGSHGKTTVTSMMACLFEAAGEKPTVINGGIINNRKTNAYLGSGDYLIAEADESDATFIKIPSSVAVITNIDPEHLDFYGSFDNLMSAFEKFILNLPFYGFAVCCTDHQNVAQLCSKITTRQIVTYGIDKGADIRACNIELYHDHSKFDVQISLPDQQKRTLRSVYLPVAGRHNVLNALAAIATGTALNFSDNTLISGFKEFKGVKRRFTNLGIVKGASIIDDYAHHPDEIKATLETAKIVKEKEGGRIVAVFQPHRYSRIKLLKDEFIQSLSGADVIINTDVYSTGENKIDGISARSLHTEIKDKYPGRHADYIPKDADFNDVLTKNIRSGDIVILMGAGSISALGSKFVERCG